ncbi:twitching motility protein PilT [Patulibacter sp. NPDC049589]|uniref:twitching motility protein PilT n=1 Tax=Patulibacter sp. NPDC049589 TaxID=3154731 RepID=UPI00344540D6
MVDPVATGARAPERGLTYDAGALIALERADRTTWALHAAALRRGIRPTLPTVVLGQTWRGGPQAQLSRAVRGCRVEALDEYRARAAGTLLAAAASSDLVDAAVVIGALRRHDAVVTSDPGDLSVLADAAGRDLVLLEV